MPISQKVKAQTKEKFNPEKLENQEKSEKIFHKKHKKLAYL